MMYTKFLRLTAYVFALEPRYYRIPTVEPPAIKPCTQNVTSLFVIWSLLITKYKNNSENIFHFSKKFLNNNFYRAQWMIQLIFITVRKCSSPIVSLKPLAVEWTPPQMIPALLCTDKPKRTPTESQVLQNCKTSIPMTGAGISTHFNRNKHLTSHTQCTIHGVCKIMYQ